MLSCIDRYQDSLFSILNKASHRSMEHPPQYGDVECGDNTVQCHYNAVNFLQNPHKRLLIARPLRRAMGCPLVIQILIYILLQSLQWYWWIRFHMCCLSQPVFYYTPRTTKLLGGYTGFTPSVRPSVRLSVRPSVRPSRMPCPLCIIYSYGWILFILGTNDHYHERVCRAPWPLTLTYIFKVIWPWLRKSCPLCSVYSSGWILSIFGTNDHYH